MTSIILAIVIICLLAALIMYGFKPYDYGGSVKQVKKIEKTDDSTDMSLDSKSLDSKWRSVKIRPGMAPCRPVAEITGRIFLAQAAPSLPLANCTKKNCRCRYIFLEDRRSGTDRRLELGRFGDYLPNYEGERRQVTGRRYADLAA
jgi:hypothetical protein